jgi:hypothetical protein
MNVDPYRERCQIEELKPAKLRRVSFCVDVEIAGPAKYTDDKANEAPPSPPPTPGQGLNLAQPEAPIITNKTERDKKIKEISEGEALKHPQAMVDIREESGDVTVMENGMAGDMTSVPPKPGVQMKEPSRKKEKKKRSEEERKERKELRRQAAVANGTAPVEISRDESSSGYSTPQLSTPSKSQNQPTTDPLRIYRRCCQLRETSVLKKIAEQVASPTAADPSSPGTILCLDLSGYWIELPDVITFGDYLAIVPVKKLLLENCGLTDEALRIILAGLLAAKTPDQAKYNKHLKKKVAANQEKAERHGVIEKLSLRNNPMLGNDGWGHIGLFIYLSQSLKGIDLSMIPFPTAGSTANSTQSLLKVPTASKSAVNVAAVFPKCLGERLAGSQLEEIVLAECQLTTQHIGRLIDAVIECGVERLGLASNELSTEALHFIAKYLKSGKCEGLDLGGNDLSESLDILSDALEDSSNPLYALSLADCNLSPASLKPLFPALSRLENFRFMDLSHNRSLFAMQPSALGLLRNYLPQFPALKRLHLADVDMSSEHAIALAEVLPEIHSLCHIGILENPQLTALASAKDESSQEEACALYASLMAAVRVSSSILCIDIDIPTQDSSEVVKALAKQVVAYSLRNMERGPVAEAYASEAAIPADSRGADRTVNVPDVLLHLVGHVEGLSENRDDGDPAPDDDYIVGGTGVVKALGVCLGNRAADYWRLPPDASPGSGTATPRKPLAGSEMTKGKAKEMSKNLLGSARKIRARLQPALASANDEMACSKYFFRNRCRANQNTERLKFLDSTLERVIQRFEEEYPECRLAQPHTPLGVESAAMPDNLASALKNRLADGDSADGELIGAADDDDASPAEDGTQLSIVRHNSDVSLASRSLGLEEGRMHRFGQKFRRDILRPRQPGPADGFPEDRPDTLRSQNIRAKLEAMDGTEMREKIEDYGSNSNGLLQQLGTSAEELLRLEQEDPEGFDAFKQAHLAAQINAGRPPADVEEPSAATAGT